MALFMVADPYPGASTNVRRALAAMKRFPCMDRVTEAARALGVEAKSPFWLRDCWAQIGFPKLKVAVFFPPNRGNTTIVNPHREAWEKAGWQLLVVGKQDVDRTGDEQLRADLKAALDSVKKGGKR